MHIHNETIRDWLKLMHQRTWESNKATRISATLSDRLYRGIRLNVGGFSGIPRGSMIQTMLHMEGKYEHRDNIKT